MAGRERLGQTPAELVPDLGTVRIHARAVFDPELVVGGNRLEARRGSVEDLNRPGKLETVHPLAADVHGRISEPVLVVVGRAQRVTELVALFHIALDARGVL